MKPSKIDLEKENKRINTISKKEPKTGYNLLKYFGVLKGDKEYDMIKKELKAGWRKWSRRYQ